MISSFKRYQLLKLNSSIFILCMMFSCADSSESKITIDYANFHHQQNGWKSKRITQFISDINYTATEVPLQYYLLKNAGGNQNIDSLFQSVSKERIMEFEFEHSDKSDLLQEKFTDRIYEESVKYMAFKMENDFYAITSANDTIPCSGIHFERNFKVAPFKRVLIYFKNIDSKQNIKLVYHDRLFGNGIIKFNFQETPIQL